ncbi:natural cytotoxicity triggering receptor 3 ligand 1, partial [Artibeus jamaicensis]|uniref:natural cytotoxicity triggering receptor 3 ligand 1 n=1 Tax=Artibeus jamaicensis TaxID=9417 RepID=UPI00235B1ED7
MAVDAEAAAARTLCGFMRMLLVLVLGLPALRADSLRVEMAGETQTVLLNHNATISCLVLGTSQLDIKHMAVTWFRKNSVNGTYVRVFEFYGEHQEARRSGADVSLQGLAKGNASLQLPEVQLWEAGEYRCEVVNTPYKDQGTIFLKVVACPDISLSVEKAKVKDNDYQRLLCKSRGFYPNHINITWCEWNQEYSQCLNISENITTNAAIENDNKTFSVSSYLMPKHSPEHGGTYQCMVQHMPLCTPQKKNITLPENGSESKSDLWKNPLKY